MRSSACIKASAGAWETSAGNIDSPKSAESHCRFIASRWYHPHLPFARAVPLADKKLLLSCRISTKTPYPLFVIVVVPLGLVPFRVLRTTSTTGSPVRAWTLRGWERRALKVPFDTRRSDRLLGNCFWAFCRTTNLQRRGETHCGKEGRVRATDETV